MSLVSDESTRSLLEAIIVRVSDSREAVSREADRLAMIELQLRKLTSSATRPSDVAPNGEAEQATTASVDVNLSEAAIRSVSHEEAISTVLQHIQTVNSKTGGPAPWRDIYEVLEEVGKTGKTLSGLSTQGLIAMNGEEGFTLTAVGLARLDELSGKRGQ